MRRFTSTIVIILLSVMLLASACQSRKTPTPAPAPAPTIPTSTLVASTPAITPVPNIPVTPTTSPKAEPTGTLSVAVDFLGTEATDPSLTGSSKLYLELVFDQMIAANKSGTAFAPERSVISKWDRSADGRTWTFDVREGIKFHDGSPLTAADIKFSIERVIDSGSKYSYAGPVRQLVESVNIINPYRLVVNTKPNFVLAYYLSEYFLTEGMVLPKAYIEKNGIEYFREHPVGSGPYKLVKHTPGEFTFEALPEHWAIGVPKYKTIIFRAVPEESTRIAMLKRNEADIISATREKSVGLQKEGFNVFENQDSSLTWAIMHQQWKENTPFKDIRVREALNIAINREEIAKYVFLGKARPESNAVHSWSIGYEKLPPYPYDPAKAKQLLKDAGYPNGFEINYNWFPFNTVPEQKQVAEAVAGYWEAVGIKVKMAQMEWGAYRPKWSNAEFPDPAAGMGVLDATVFSSSYLYIMFHSKESISLVSDPKLDKMLEEIPVAVDQSVAENKLAEASRYIRSNHFAIPLVAVSSLIVTNSKIKEWQFGKMQNSFQVRNNAGIK